MSPPFAASAAKIARAKRHFEELRSGINEYFDRGSAYIAFEMAPEYCVEIPGTASFTFREVEPVPIEWSAIIGDVLHNLRSALDLIACEVFSLTGGDPRELSRVHYPFCKSKSELRETIKNRRLSRIGSQYLSLLEGTAPYRGGNEGLYAIHHLNVLDKHQALVPTLSIVEVDWPVPIRKGAQKFATRIDKDGQRIVIIPRNLVPLKLGTRINADFSIVFGQIDIFEGRDVIKQLQPCIQSVAHILRLFGDSAAASAEGVGS